MPLALLTNRFPSTIPPGRAWRPWLEALENTFPRTVRPVTLLVA
jgi:hypothetical protein